MLNAERENAIDKAEAELVEWIDGKRSWVIILDGATRVEVMMVDTAAQQALALSIIALKTSHG